MAVAAKTLKKGKLLGDYDAPAEIVRTGGTGFHCGREYSLLLIFMFDKYTLEIAFMGDKLMHFRVLIR